jgi:hypothetical protein
MKQELRPIKTMLAIYRIDSPFCTPPHTMIHWMCMVWHSSSPPLYGGAYACQTDGEAEESKRWRRTLSKSIVPLS